MKARRSREPELFEGINENIYPVLLKKIRSSKPGGALEASLTDYAMVRATDRQWQKICEIVDFRPCRSASTAKT